MKGLKFFVWQKENKDKSWIEDSLKDKSCEIVFYEKKNQLSEKYLKKFDLAIVDEDFEKKFNFPMLKVILSENEEENKVKYGDKKHLREAVNFYISQIFSFLYLIPSPSFLLDKNKKIIKANKGFLNLIDEKRVLGKHLYEVFFDIEKKIEGWEEIFSIEVKYLARNFEEKVFELNYQKIKDFYFVTLKDITVEKKKKNLVFLVEKARAIATLAGGVAHDLNNILMIISSYSTLIERNIEKEEIKKFIEEINKGVGKAKELTDMLLAFSGKQLLNPKVIDLYQFFEKFVEEQKKKNQNIRFELLLSENLPFIKIDKEKFEKILENIIKNSSEAMPEGGTLLIEVNLNKVEKYYKEFPILDAGNWVQIAITDSGSGMSADISKRVFEPFFSTKPKGKGKGFGLAEAYGFIKQSEGYIFCSSEEGIGTTIHIFLKVYEGKERPETLKMEEKKLEEKSFKGKNVLIIEDETVLLSSLSMILAASGFNVLKASSGEEAIEIVKNTKENIDLIISDIILPGIDGKEAVDRIIKEKPKIPAIFMSGYSDNILAKHNVIKNNLNFITKPFKIDDLVYKIMEVLKRKEKENSIFS